MATRRVFLTGATGFVGRHVARALREDRWSVRALCRRSPSAAAGAPADPGFETVVGDLSSTAELEAGLADCEAIVHVAGLVKARTLEEYRLVNRRGTERLVRAGLSRAPNALFLLVSSQAAAGPARDGRPVTEDDPARPVSWYGVSKREGEEAVASDWRGPWIILRPGVLYGPGDRGLLTYFRLAASGWLPIPAARTRIQMGAVEEFALAVARALRRPDLAGRRGFLCDPAPLALRDLGLALATLPARRPRLVPIPNTVVRLAGLFETVRESLTGRSRPFNADKARELLAGDWLCDPTPMRTDLALPAPAPLAEGLRQAWDWYRAAGWL